MVIIDRINFYENDEIIENYQSGANKVYFEREELKKSEKKGEETSKGWKSLKERLYLEDNQ